MWAHVILHVDTRKSAHGHMRVHIRLTHAVGTCGSAHAHDTCERYMWTHAKLHVDTCSVAHALDTCQACGVHTLEAYFRPPHVTATCVHM